MAGDVARDRDFHEALCLATGGDYARAGDVFLNCVIADAGDGRFVQEFLDNLERRASSREAIGAPARETVSQVQRAITENDWPAVLAYGPRLLHERPRDTVVLLALAEACESRGFAESERCYLRAALRAGGEDANMLRRAALAFARLKEFAEAIDCWRKVEALDASDEEPGQMIVTLSVALSRQRAGLPGTEDLRANAAVRPALWRRGDPPIRLVTAPLDALAPAAMHASGLPLSPIQRLDAAIRERPSIGELYLRLAQLYLDKDRDYDAERLLSKGREATDRDARVQQMWEEVTMLRHERRVAIAEEELRGADNPQTQAALAQAKKDRDRVETEIFLSRTKRDPQNAENQYQLGLCLARGDKLREAADHLEKSMAQLRLRGAAALALGHCQEKLGEIGKALRYYRVAAEETDAEQIEQRKEALYRAGRLSRAIKLNRLAQRYLATLLRMDPGHREAAVLLEECG